MKKRKREKEFAKKYEDERKPQPILAKTERQKNYLTNLRQAAINIAIGPAGVGKTYLPSCMAGDMLRSNSVEKIILVRPYVQTGKTSGYKPGNSYEKLYPYVRSMLDTIKKRMGDGAYNVAIKDGIRGDIEVCELESVRGRSFDDKCWIIFDEMQQSTKDEMIALITRLGDNCNVTICGDINQKDIKGQDGLSWLVSFSKRHGLGIPINRFTSDDIVRSGLVKSIVKGLEKDGEFNQH